MSSAIPAPVAHEVATIRTHALVVERERRSCADEIDLVQHEELRPGIESCAVFGQLAVDRTEAFLEVGLRGVEDVDEETCALEVSEELMAEAGSVRRALDEARHVGDRQLALLRAVHHPQHRLESRERIVRDLRLGIRQPAEKRDLPAFGKPASAASTTSLS